MINGKRKTIGVFSCKAYSLFDRALYKTLEEQWAYGSRYIMINAGGAGTSAELRHHHLFHGGLFRQPE